MVAEMPHRRAGNEGFAEVLTDGGWRAVTQDGARRAAKARMNYDLDMPPYIQEMADWLDDRRRCIRAVSRMPGKGSRS